MLKSNYIVSIPEMRLIDAIETLGYGELVDVEIPDAQIGPCLKMLTEKQASLLDKIRNGHRHFDKIIVHQGEPTEVQNALEVQGYTGVRKLRL